MKGKKWIAALMAAVLGVSMLAGCGTKEKTKINVAAAPPVWAWCS